MARRQEGILRQIRDEAKHQLRGFPREPCPPKPCAEAGSSTNCAASAARPVINSAAAGATSSPDRFSGRRSDVKDDAAQGRC